MKKYIALILVLVAMLSLCACGEKPDTNTETTTQATESKKELTVEEKKDLALTCVDKTVDELYDLIGQPESSDYAPSCLNPDGGAEDGELYYEGFTVYTYKTADGETIVDVE